MRSIRFAGGMKIFFRRSVRPVFGFTLIELILVTLLMSVLVVLCFGVISGIARTSGRAGRGGHELVLAAKLAERYRIDIRTADKVFLLGGNTRLRAVKGVEIIEYGLNASGRLERKGSDGSAVVGPRLSAMSFDILKPSGTRIGWLVRARWECFAERPFRDPSNVEAPRLLILDTALRGVGE